VRVTSVIIVCALAAIAIVPLIAATWLIPPGFPHLLRQMILCAFLAYPMAWVFERGGRSLVGPAILHTSTNTPAIILALPEEIMATALVMHMAVILVSVYLVFLVRAGTPNSSGEAVLT
jgi:hypothetical protein